MYRMRLRALGSLGSGLSQEAVVPASPPSELLAHTVPGQTELGMGSWPEVLTFRACLPEHLWGRCFLHASVSLYTGAVVADAREARENWTSLVNTL